MSFIFNAIRCYSASAILLLIVACLNASSVAFAECNEYMLVEYEDRIEAVCIGNQVTSAQKQTPAAVAAEEENSHEQEIIRQKAEDNQRQNDLETANVTGNNLTETQRSNNDGSPVSTDEDMDNGRNGL